MIIALQNLTRRKQIIAAGATLLILILGAWLFIRPRNKQENNPEFNKYIESYTAGMISKTGTIRIRLAGDVQIGHTKNEPVSSSVFDFSPSIDGKAYWVDERTIEFKPEGDLKPGKNYDAEFNLGKVIDVPGDLSTFKFDFQTIKSDYTFTINGLQSATRTSVDHMKLTGVIQMADREDPAKVEKMLVKTYPTPVLITWKHNTAANSHTFTIDNITRTNAAQKLHLEWDGAPLDMEGKGSEDVEIPAIGDFKV